MRGEKIVMSSVHPTKSTGEFMAKRVAFLKENGREMVHITIKTDQEPAMVTMVEGLCKERAKRGAMRASNEHSPQCSSKSNGVVERAVQSVEGQMRVMWSYLEEKLGMKIATGHGMGRRRMRGSRERKRR